MPQISKATEYNWKRLESDFRGKLTKRANKTLSERRVVASGYLDYAPANRLLETVSALGQSIGDIMYSLCISRLKYADIFDNDNVKDYFSKITDYRLIDIDLPDAVWDSDEDALGFIYQSLLTEGERNLTGQYYTGRRVTDYLLEGKRLSDGETLLDPCCGSGAFLLSVKSSTPSCLYGFDINPVAVMIAATNLLVKYAGYDFTPNVYCIDYLNDKLSESTLPDLFDNIYTNPPWGADKEKKYAACYPSIRSGERASMVIAESLRRLKEDGEACFLLPASLLKIRRHGDVRRLILSDSTVRTIDLFSDRFDGVFTDYFSVKLNKSRTFSQVYDVVSVKGIETINLSVSDRNNGIISLEKLSEDEENIIKKIESRRNDDLRHSQWALGIVTGDNKNKVRQEREAGLEPVYTGKQVISFLLKQEASYISFEPKNFQQCAREAFYRAPEKLIYRFIAKYPIVAYDDKQRLCLNSANILIPEVEGISMKSVAALLNSSLYRYYYSVKFQDIKVLKGNLQELPFPKLTQGQDEELSALVSSICVSGYSEAYQQELDEAVYAIFEITPSEQRKIMEKLSR